MTTTRRLDHIEQGLIALLTPADILASAAWAEVAAAIETALAPYPAAQAAVAEQLRALAAVEER